MTRNATWAVVPVKDLERAKRRLVGAFDPAARRGLSLAMLADVLDALDAAPSLAGVAVISRDATVAKLALGRGLRVIPETGAGLNAAVSQAAKVLSAEGCARLLVVPADVPRVDPEEIAGVLAALHATPGLALVPDRHGTGTNAFACSPPAAVAPCFGEDSFACHLAVARDAGIPARVLRLPGLGLDIDTLDDLTTFARQPGSTQTHAFLAAEAPTPMPVARGRS